MDGIELSDSDHFRCSRSIDGIEPSDSDHLRCSRSMDGIEPSDSDHLRCSRSMDGIELSDSDHLFSRSMDLSGPIEPLLILVLHNCGMYYPVMRWCI